MRKERCNNGLEGEARVWEDEEEGEEGEKGEEDKPKEAVRGWGRDLWVRYLVIVSSWSLCGGRQFGS